MRTLVIFGSLLLAAVLFSIPLFLKYHVFRPTIKRVSTGDVVEVVGRISTTWCQAVELKSASKFQPFVFETEPEVNPDYLERTVSTYHLKLPNQAQEYWGFHLLRGSKVNISTCSRFSGAELTVVKGQHGLRRCLDEYSRFLGKKGETSAEDSESESESDDVTSSISSSQGAVSNETTRGYICKNALHYSRLSFDYTCRSNFRSASRKFTLFHEIRQTGYYYYIFSSDTYLDIIPNEFSVEFRIDRTMYNYASSSTNCSSTIQCQLAVPLASERKIVVHMEGVNGTVKSEKLEIACKPREWLFFIFYAMFLGVIFICAFQ